MTYLLLASALLALLAAITWRIRSRKQRVEVVDELDTVQAWPPRATRVLNDPERKAYELLRHALPAQMILAQVPLQRFVKVPTRNSYAEWLRRVGQISADFVICDTHSQVMAVIEVEGEQEAPGSRSQRRRARMLRVLKAAEVPVQVWRPGAFPSVSAVREAILPPAAVPDLPDLPTVADAQAGDAAADPLREPPPSTWFDDLETTPVPLVIGGAKAAGPRTVH